VPRPKDDGTVFRVPNSTVGMTLTQARNAFNDGEVRYRVALANLQTLTGTM